MATAKGPKEDLPALKIKVAEVRRRTKHSQQINSFSLFAVRTTGQRVQRQIRRTPSSESNDRRQIGKGICQYRHSRVSSIRLSRRIFIDENRFNRVEKSKPCERCDEFERMIDVERKSNAQLKRLIEQKEKTPRTTTSNGSCHKCPELNELLKIEKDNSKELTEQVQRERNAKEVSLSRLNLPLGETLSI